LQLCEDFDKCIHEDENKKEHQEFHKYIDDYETKIKTIRETIDHDINHKKTEEGDGIAGLNLAILYLINGHIRQSLLWFIWSAEEIIGCEKEDYVETFGEEFTNKVNEYMNMVKDNIDYEHGLRPKFVNYVRSLNKKMELSREITKRMIKTTKHNQEELLKLQDSLKEIQQEHVTVIKPQHEIDKEEIIHLRREKRKLVNELIELQEKYDKLKESKS
jgi:hypothetical protein